eukprot:2833092-Amphidinium_carterae.1
MSPMGMPVPPPPALNGLYPLAEGATTKPCVNELSDAQNSNVSRFLFARAGRSDISQELWYCYRNNGKLTGISPRLQLHLRSSAQKSRSTASRRSSARRAEVGDQS